jgi:serine/threonine-protein kinase
VRRVSSRGIITTLAGNGHPGFSGDGGPARMASVVAGPLLAAPDGGFWIAADNRVRRVWPDGTITVAGDGRFNGPLGDGGPATAAPLSDIQGIARQDDGSLLIAD